jgi:hypothetical protein
VWIIVGIIFKVIGWGWVVVIEIAGSGWLLHYRGKNYMARG